MNNPYEAPTAELVLDQNEFVYVGFWLRVGAMIIDGLIVALISYPILYLAYGTAYFAKTELLLGSLDFIISYLFPIVWTVGFWIYRQATPGKMVIGARLVSVKTGGKPSVGQCIGRYFGYILSALPLGLGYLWAAWDPKKQTWHDKLAGTYVVRG